MFVSVEKEKNRSYHTVRLEYVHHGLRTMTDYLEEHTHTKWV